MLDTLREKVRLARDIILPPRIPGWDLVNRFRGIYRIKAQFVCEQGQTPENRIPKVMPVEPNYEVIENVELLGPPRVVSHEEIAANPRNMNLPTIEQLQTPNFYEGTVIPQKALTPQWRSEELGTDLDRHSQDVLSPVEAHPFTTNVFVFPALNVSFTCAVQPLGQATEGVVMRNSTPSRFANQHLDIGSKMEEKSAGVGYVAHIRVPVDLTEYFRTPDDMKNFNGAITGQDPNTDLASSIFENLFRGKLERIGAEVETKRKRPVIGVLLSPITVHSRIADNILSLARDPEGEFIVAATYLMETPLTPEAIVDIFGGPSNVEVSPAGKGMCVYIKYKFDPEAIVKALQDPKLKNQSLFLDYPTSVKPKLEIAIRTACEQNPLWECDIYHD
ncbi:hypothetical protein M0P48_01615 [Candidatus Gracilibacteria bacterium]|nr:hypothetical protein [Candidatus Gracilibacteria bacterium]